MGKKDSASLKRMAELKRQAKMMADNKESGAGISVPDKSSVDKCGQNQRSRRVRDEPVWDSDDNFPRVKSFSHQSNSRLIRV